MTIWALILYLSAFRGADNFWAGYFSWLLGIWIATLIHETAHALTAVACNWRVLFVRVGRFALKLSNRDFGIVPRSALAQAGGLMAAVPRSASDGSKDRFVKIVASGPAASALAAVASLIVAIVWLPPFNRDGVDASLIGFAFFLQSSHLAVFSLLPAWRPGGSSDGDKLRKLCRADSEWERDRAVAWLRTIDLSNERLRDAPKWILEEARKSENADIARYLAAMDIGIALDASPVDKSLARTLIDEFRSAHGSSAWLASCDAYLAAIWEADAAKARATLWNGEATQEEQPIVMAAEAAVAAREGNKPLALSQLAEMRIAVKAQSPFRNPTFIDIGQQIEAVIAGNL